MSHMAQACVVASSDIGSGGSTSVGSTLSTGAVGEGGEVAAAPGCQVAGEVAPPDVFPTVAEGGGGQVVDMSHWDIVTPMVVGTTPAVSVVLFRTVAGSDSCPGLESGRAAEIPAAAIPNSGALQWPPNLRTRTSRRIEAKGNPILCLLTKF